MKTQAPKQGTSLAQRRGKRGLAAADPGLAGWARAETGREQIRQILRPEAEPQAPGPTALASTSADDRSLVATQKSSIDASAATAHPVAPSHTLNNHVVLRANAYQPGDNAREREAEEAADRAVRVLGAEPPAWGPAGDVPETSVVDDVRVRVEMSRGRGQPLAPALRVRMESALDMDLVKVRVHDDAPAHALADQLDARAFTSGLDVFFSEGEFNPGSTTGQQLLAHEFAHVAQQGGRVAGPIERRGKPKASTKPKERPIKRVTLYVDQNLVVLELDDGEVVAVTPSWNGRPAPGTYHVTQNAPGLQTVDPIPSGTANPRGYVVEWNHPYATLARKKPFRYVFEVVGGKGVQGKGDGIGIGPGESIKPPKVQEHQGSQDAKDAADTNKDGADTGQGSKDRGVDGTGDKDGADHEEPGEGIGDSQGTRQDDGTGDGVNGSQGGTAEQRASGGSQGGTDQGRTDAQHLLPEAERAWRELYDLTKNGKGVADGSPAELVRLYQILRSKVSHPVFSEEGEDWVKFARFLETNRDKIEGILQGASKTKLTIQRLEAILDEYGKFVVAEPVKPSGHSDMGSFEDFDKEFEYDPGWARLSLADRRLLIEFSRMNASDVRKQGDKIDFAYVTTSMKVNMALKLARNWAAAIREQAIAAFTDWKFIATLVVTMGIYVGLWLTPDPSLVTKVAAAVLTAVLLTQFAIEDIYGLYQAWGELTDDCRKAVTAKELQAAGDRFADKVGQVGFDILLFIVTWRLGKAVEPKLRAYGMKRAVVRADAAVATAEAKPGSGAPATKNPEGRALLDAAKARTKGGTPTEILDALAESLPEPQKSGLAKLRATAKDPGALQALEGQSAKGDVARFLSEKVLSKVEAAQAKADLARARLRRARLRVIEMETIKDPKLKSQTRAQIVADLVEWFKETVFKGEALEGRMQDVLIAELGETLARAQLAEEFAGRAGIRILSNIEVVRKVPFETVAEWKANEIANGRSGTTAKLRFKGNEIFESVGELDALVTQDTPAGKIKPLVMEQVKTGGNDSHARAAAQNTKAMTGSAEGAKTGQPPGGLQAVAAGDPTVRVFERVTKTTLGNEYTAQLDLTDLGSVEQRTRLPLGRGIAGQPNLPFSLELLEDVARSLRANYPRTSGPVKPPNVSPRPEPREGESP